jgi:serralysin
VKTLEIRVYLADEFDHKMLVRWLKDLVKVSGSSTKAVVTYEDSGIGFVLEGTGFRFDSDGKLIAGNITYAGLQIQIDEDEFQQLAEYSNMSLDVSRVLSDPWYNPFSGMSINYSATQYVVDHTNRGVFTTGTRLADKIIGSSGNDQLAGQGGEDELYGGAGHDLLMGGAEGVYFNGGIGLDTVAYATATRNVTASLTPSIKNTGFAAGDTFESIENLFGSMYSDKLYGSAEDNMLLGLNGRDILGRVDKVSDPQPDRRDENEAEEAIGGFVVSRG